MTTKIKGTAGIEFPDATVQATAATKPPAFSAKRSSDLSLTSGSWATVVFPIEELDTNNWYDPSTGKFTPQVAGWYQANIQISINGTSITTTGVGVWKNDSLTEVSFYKAGSAVSGGQITSASNLIYLNGSTDFIIGKVIVTGTTPKVDGTLPSKFSSFLVRAD